MEITLNVKYKEGDHVTMITDREKSPLRVYGYKIEYGVVKYLCNGNALIYELHETDIEPCIKRNPAGFRYTGYGDRHHSK